MASEPLFHEGINLFNAGRYYQAHEVWEDLWRITDGPLRPFYQGLIHAAVGLYHLDRENSIGGRSQLAKSLRNLTPFSPDCCGIDTAGLIIQLRGVLEEPDRQEVRIRMLAPD